MVNAYSSLSYFQFLFIFILYYLDRQILPSYIIIFIYRLIVPIQFTQETVILQLVKLKKLFVH